MLGRGDCSGTRVDNVGDELEASFRRDVVYAVDECPHVYVGQTLLHGKQRLACQQSKLPVDVGH